MTDSLKNTLTSLAEKYEVPSFCDADPSQFLRWYGEPASDGSNIADIEACSFIAAMLAFGSRKQFLPKIRYIMELADKTSGSISKWLISGDFITSFPSGEEHFYRFYSYDSIRNLFADLSVLLKEGGTGGIGEAFRLKWEEAKENENKKKYKLLLSDVISSSFPNARIVPKGIDSANKRIHMFLRWMVRRNSPVDLGLWTWYSPKDLLIPLDVHVMEEGIRLGALPEKARATRKTAIALTESLKEIWPDDPCKGDFALFGLGVDK